MQNFEFDVIAFIKAAKVPTCRCRCTIVNGEGMPVPAGYTRDADGVARAIMMARDCFAEFHGCPPGEMRTSVEGSDTLVSASGQLIACFNKLSRAEQRRVEEEWLEAQLEREKRIKPPGEQIPPDFLRSLLKEMDPWETRGE